MQRAETSIPRRSDWGSSHQWAFGQLGGSLTPLTLRKPQSSQERDSMTYRGEADKDAVTCIDIQGISAERNQRLHSPALLTHFKDLGNLRPPRWAMTGPA